MKQATDEARMGALENLAVQQRAMAVAAKEIVAVKRLENPESAGPKVVVFIALGPDDTVRGVIDKLLIGEGPADEH